MVIRFLDLFLALFQTSTVGMISLIGMCITLTSSFGFCVSFLPFFHLCFNLGGHSIGIYVYYDIWYTFFFLILVFTTVFYSIYRIHVYYI